MTEVTATFETGVDGSDVLTTDAGSATAWNTRVVNGGTLKYSSTEKSHGSLSCKFDHSSSASNKNIGWTTALGTLDSTHYGRFYLFVTAAPGVSTYIMDGYTSASKSFQIRLLTDLTLRSFDGVGGVGGTSTALSINTWYRIEYMVVHSATVGQIVVKIFTGDSAVADQTLTSAANKNTRDTVVDAITFGCTEGTGGSWIQYMDDIVAGAASYPGPVAAAASADPPTAHLATVQDYYF